MKKILMFMLIALQAATWKTFVFGYENTITHPKITQAAIEQLSFQDKCIDTERLTILKVGSEKEDDLGRPINHFLPVLSSLTATACDPITWGVNGYCPSQLRENIFSWGNAVDKATFNDKDDNLYNLGFVLHLLQDMSVPAHVRGDSHLYIPDFHAECDGDYCGEPFEAFGALPRSRIDFKDVDLTTLSEPNEYFLVLSKYTRENYFSTDTCFDPLQVGPSANYEDDKYFYAGYDGQSRKLAHKGTRYWARVDDLTAKFLEAYPLLEATKKAREQAKILAPHIDMAIAEKQFQELSGYAVAYTKEFIRSYFTKIASSSSIGLTGSSDVSGEITNNSSEFIINTSANIDVKPVGIPIKVACISASTDPRIADLTAGDGRWNVALKYSSPSNILFKVTESPYAPSISPKQLNFTTDYVFPTFSNPTLAWYKWTRYSTSCGSVIEDINEERRDFIFYDINVDLPSMRMIKGKNGWLPYSRSENITDYSTRSWTFGNGVATWLLTTKTSEENAVSKMVLNADNGIFNISWDSKIESSPYCGEGNIGTAITTDVLRYQSVYEVDFLPYIGPLPILQ